MTRSTRAHDRTRVRDLLASRPVRLYLFGQVASAFGDNAMWIAAGIWVKELTGSTSAAGLLVFVIVAPQTLGSPFAGMIADRANRKWFLAAANAAGALTVLPMLIVQSRASVWLIYISMGTYGLAVAAINTGQSALLADIVPPRLLSAANGTLRGGREALRIAAPVTGAYLLTIFGPPSIILLEAATFIGAALCVLRLPRPAPAEARVRTTPTAEFAAGIRFAWTDLMLRKVMLAGALIFASYGLSESVIYAIADILHRPAGFVGVLSSTTGIGGVIGGLTAVSFARRTGNVRLSLTGMIILALACPLQASGIMPVVLLGEMLFGLSLPWTAVGLYTLIQMGSPSHLQGRVYGAFEVFSGAPQTAAIAGGAGLIALLSARYLLAVMAVLALCSAAIMYMAGTAGERGTVPGKRRLPTGADHSAVPLVEEGENAGQVARWSILHQTNVIRPEGLQEMSDDTQGSSFSIDDPIAMRALAHPRRLEILTLLRDYGPSTVTQISRSTGDSTASISYHVQQLSKYGFIERAAEVDRGREKPWRARDVSYTFSNPEEQDPSSRSAAQALRWALITQTRRMVDAYASRSPSLPREWQDAAVISENTLCLTADELREISLSMLKLLKPYQKRRPDQSPPDSRYSHIILYGIPSGLEGPGEEILRSEHTTSDCQDRRMKWPCRNSYLAM